MQGRTKKAHLRATSEYQNGRTEGNVDLSLFKPTPQQLNLFEAKIKIWNENKFQLKYAIAFNISMQWQKGGSNIFCSLTFWKMNEFYLTIMFKQQMLNSRIWDIILHTHNNTYYLSLLSLCFKVNLNIVVAKGSVSQPVLPNL